MKKFILHIVILGLVVAASIGYIFSKADGYSDPFYLKFTSTKKSNLILGTSKAAQGLQPNVLKDSHGKDFFNYAFALNSSPYGKAYFQSIQNKINIKNTNQNFILSVDPWSLSSTTDLPNDSLNFRENKSYIGKINDPNQSINYHYLFNYFDESYYKLLKKNSVAFLDDNGWLSVNLPDDSLSVTRRRKFTISGYKDKVTNYHFSPIRYQYFLKTIGFLKKFGKVFLVRLPVHSTLMDLENQIMPNFNQDIHSATELSAGYLDLSNKNANFQYTDGVHLTKISGKEVSRQIGEWMADKN